jgi:hypothetical protein
MYSVSTLDCFLSKNKTAKTSHGRLDILAMFAPQGHPKDIRLTSQTQK